MSQQARQIHAKEFKEEAVKLVKEQGCPVAEAARNLRLSPSVICRWKREFEKREGGESDAASIVHLQGELKHLRKKNKRLEMEREILKKSARAIEDEQLIPTRQSCGQRIKKER